MHKLNKIFLSLFGAILFSLTSCSFYSVYTLSLDTYFDYEYLLYKNKNEEVYLNYRISYYKKEEKCAYFIFERDQSRIPFSINLYSENSQIKKIWVNNSKIEPQDGRYIAITYPSKYYPNGLYVISFYDFASIKIEFDTSEFEKINFTSSLVSPVTKVTEYYDTYEIDYNDEQNI